MVAPVTSPPPTTTTTTVVVDRRPIVHKMAVFALVWALIRFISWFDTGLLRHLPFRWMAVVVLLVAASVAIATIAARRNPTVTDRGGISFSWLLAAVAAVVALSAPYGWAYDIFYEEDCEQGEHFSREVTPSRCVPDAPVVSTDTTAPATTVPAQKDLTDADREAIAKKTLRGWGWSEDEIAAGSQVVFEGVPEERGSASFIHRTLKSQGDISNFLNDASAESVAARNRVLAALSADEHQRALSGQGYYPVQFKKAAQYLGTTYFSGNEVITVSTPRQTEANDILWLYFRKDGVIERKASIRADCGNPDLEKVIPVRSSTKPAPPIAQPPTPPTTPVTRPPVATTVTSPPVTRPPVATTVTSPPVTQPPGPTTTVKDCSRPDVICGTPTAGVEQLPVTPADQQVAANRGVGEPAPGHATQVNQQQQVIPADPITPTPIGTQQSNLPAQTVTGTQGTVQGGSTGISNPAHNTNTAGSNNTAGDPGGFS